MKVCKVCKVCNVGFTLLLLASPVVAENLEGVFERVSLTNTRTGESPEAMNRKGLLILYDGHYSMMTMNPERRYIPENELDSLSDSEIVGYLREWLDINAHSGRYEAADGSLTWYRDISEDPREVGTVSRLRYEWREELLVIWFELPGGDRYDWVWRPVAAES